MQFGTFRTGSKKEPEKPTLRLAAHFDAGNDQAIAIGGFLAEIARIGELQRILFCHQYTRTGKWEKKC